MLSIDILATNSYNPVIIKGHFPPQNGKIAKWTKKMDKERTIMTLTITQLIVVQYI